MTEKTSSHLSVPRPRRYATPLSRQTGRFVGGCRTHLSHSADHLVVYSTMLTRRTGTAAPGERGHTKRDADARGDARVGFFLPTAAMVRPGAVLSAACCSKARARASSRVRLCGPPGVHCWHLIVRREFKARQAINDGLSNAPAATSRLRLAQEQGQCYWIERTFQDGESQAGLDQIPGPRQALLAPPYGTGDDGDALHAQRAHRVPRHLSAAQLCRCRDPVGSRPAKAGCRPRGGGPPIGGPPSETTVIRRCSSCETAA